MCDIQNFFDAFAKTAFTIEIGRMMRIKSGKDMEKFVADYGDLIDKLLSKYHLEVNTKEQKRNIT